MISRPLITAEDALELIEEAVFLDARAGADAPEAYGEAHLRGARRVDLETDLSKVRDPALGGRHPLPSLDAWRARLGDWGITPSTPVLIYDAGGGGMAAARAWWMLHALGHEQLAVVDGGWQALQEAAAPLESGEPRWESTDPYPSTVAAWPIVDAELVEVRRSDTAWRLIDARAPERYAGIVEPLDPVAGHIPGALNRYWQSQLDDRGRFISLSELRNEYASVLGDVPPERVICYCGSGVTACHLLLTMEACGLTGARLYVGSWSEWCRQRRAGAESE
jgi:thiosulfate/3-mercaptopyruvate sulfurtransferase